RTSGPRRREFVPGPYIQSRARLGNNSQDGQGTSAFTHTALTVDDGRQSVHQGEDAECEVGNGEFADRPVARARGRYFVIGLASSSARFTSKTFTRASPRYPNCRGLEYFAMIARTCSWESPRSCATRGT